MTEWHRLTVAMDLAVLSNDEPAWRDAFRRRESLGIDLALRPDLLEWRSPYRCPCCGRLEASGACEDSAEKAAA